MGTTCIVGLRNSLLLILFPFIQISFSPCFEQSNYSIKISYQLLNVECLYLVYRLTMTYCLEVEIQFLVHILPFICSVILPHFSTMTFFITDFSATVQDRPSPLYSSIMLYNLLFSSWNHFPSYFLETIQSKMLNSLTDFSLYFTLWK